MKIAIFFFVPAEYIVLCVAILFLQTLQLEDCLGYPFLEQLVGFRSCSLNFLFNFFNLIKSGSPSSMSREAPLQHQGRGC